MPRSFFFFFFFFHNKKCQNLFKKTHNRMILGQVSKNHNKHCSEICSITKALKDFFVLEISIGTSVEFQIIVITRGGAMSKSGGVMDSQNFEIIYMYNYFNVSKIQFIKIRVNPSKYLNQSNDVLKKNNWSNNYRDITFFFLVILFFIVNCALIFVKYLIKFDIKHV